MTRIFTTCAGARYDASGFWQMYGLGHFPDDETLGQGLDIGPDSHNLHLNLGGVSDSRPCATTPAQSRPPASKLKSKRGAQHPG